MDVAGRGAEVAAVTSSHAPPGVCWLHPGRGVLCFSTACDVAWVPLAGAGGWGGGRLGEGLGSQLKASEGADPGGRQGVRSGAPPPFSGPRGEAGLREGRADVRVVLREEVRCQAEPACGKRGGGRFLWLHHSGRPSALPPPASLLPTCPPPAPPPTTATPLGRGVRPLRWRLRRPLVPTGATALLPPSPRGLAHSRKWLN